MKLEIYHQQSMDASVVPPLPEKEETYGSFAEMFQSDNVDTEWKLKWIGQVSKFETLNSITKHDLHEALKWLFAHTHQGRRKNW